MTLPTGFQEKIDEAVGAYTHAERQLSELYGQAAFAGLSKAVQQRILAKARATGHIKTDVADIPKMVEGAQ